MEEFICCICGKKVLEWGNDPYPVVTDEGLKCCDKCDMEVVLPARIRQMNKTQRREAIQRGEK